MLENRKILTICIGYIIGIIMGLYCKISIVLIYLIFYLIYLILKKEEKAKFKLFSFKRYFRYIKIIFNPKVIKLIIIFSIISNTNVLYQNHKYDNLYKNLESKNCEFTGIITLVEDEKCKVKISNSGYKNTSLYIYLQDTNKLEYGDEIKFNGKLSLPEGKRNYKGFDKKQYYKTLKIYGTVKVEKFKIIQKDRGNIIIKHTQGLAHKIDEKIEKTSLSEEEKAILKGILLGNKANISEEIVNNFTVSNLSYILAVSGMHISYIILMSSFILNKVIGKHNSKIITSGILFVYMCIVNFTPSVIRATITGVLSIMSNFFYRKNDIWQSMGIALLILLIYNPFLILNIGLQLSFAGTLGIVIFQKTFTKLIENWLDRENRKAIRRNRRKTIFIIKLINLKYIKMIINAIIVTISATIAVAPIVVLNFNNVNITNLIISVMVSFIVGPIVILGLMLILVRINIIEILLKFFIDLLIICAKIGSKLPLNQIFIVTPSIWQVIIYYIFIYLLNVIITINLVKRQNSFQKRIKNIINVIKYQLKSNKRKVISIFLAICIIYTFILIIPKKLKVHFVDVGQGDCSLIITPRNKSILIDGGGSDFGDYDVRTKYFDAIFIRQKSFKN